MSLDKIKQLVGSLVKSVDDNERVATPILSAKLAKCLVTNPGDQTIGAMSRVISKMASNNTLFIRKSELKSLYHKLYSRNTKFAELFQDEMGAVDNLSGATTYNRDATTDEINPYEVGDQVLANALTSVFDGSIPVKMYSQVLANKAQSSVASTLDAWNLKPNSIEVSAGNDKFLVIKADYETPKGITSFFVPVEVQKNNIVEASIFMGNTGPQELNHASLKAYLTTYAGTHLNISGANILGVLTTASSENREVSGAEVALTKLTASRQGKSEFFQNSIVGQKIAEASEKEVELPKSDEFVSFEKEFTSASGNAAFQFGAEKVKIARDHIVRELVGYGHKNPQVIVTKSDTNTIIFSVALDAGRIGFTVPVKIADGKISKPTLMLCNGSVSSFSKDGINELYVSNSTDFKAAAAASPLFESKPSDVINSIRDALTEGNLEKAEDALNVLATAGDEKAYATGFQIYMNGLSGKKAEVSEHTCSMTLKNKTSEHVICGHTGLPIHKVYQDKQGNCRPLYRRGMDETYEGATFMNSKIFG